MFQIHFWKEKNWRSSLRVLTTSSSSDSQNHFSAVSSPMSHLFQHSFPAQLVQGRFGFFSLFTFPTLCILIKEITSVLTFSTSSVPEYECHIYLLVFVCHKSKSGRNICRVAWCRWDSFYPKKVFIHFPCHFSPSHLLRFYFPNSQGAQLIESMDGQMPRQSSILKGAPEVQIKGVGLLVKRSPKSITE